MKQTGFFTMDDCLDTIRMLAGSQGLYGRMLERLKELKETDRDSYDTISHEWESQRFRSSLDFMMYVEG